MEERIPKPDWIRVPIPHGDQFKDMHNLLKEHGLNTVCTEARCPNKAECWGCGTATFMVLGDICTRNCRFCAVGTAKNGQAVNNAEPQALAEAVRKLSLKYAVITSVDRDDLPDRGAGHFAACILAVRKEAPDTKIEVLIPDYRGGELDEIIAARPDVIAHNIETVASLQNVRDQRASLELSLLTLEETKAKSGIITKSSIMLGLGETEEELFEAMDALRRVRCDILVLGQYLQPGRQQLPVHRYVSPEEFADYKKTAYAKGFSSVVAAPLARTSYHARQSYPGNKE